MPWGHTASRLYCGPDIAVPVTILLIVLTINAINFIDGLDGLAAGVTAIGATAFFIYAYHLAAVGHTDIAAAPTLLSACLVGVCVGFLPHNFPPARIFMGDSKSMLIGLLHLGRGSDGDNERRSADVRQPARSRCRWRCRC